MREREDERLSPVPATPLRGAQMMRVIGTAAAAALTASACSAEPTPTVDVGITDAGPLVGDAGIYAYDAGRYDAPPAVFDGGISVLDAGVRDAAPEEPDAGAR